MVLVEAAQPFCSPFHPMPRSPAKSCHHWTGEMTTSTTNVRYAPNSVQNIAARRMTRSATSGLMQCSKIWKI